MRPRACRGHRSIHGSAGQQRAGRRLNARAKHGKSVRTAIARQGVGRSGRGDPALKAKNRPVGRGRRGKKGPGGSAPKGKSARAGRADGETGRLQPSSRMGTKRRYLKLYLQRPKRA
jgi:hypothetical protein